MLDRILKWLAVALFEVGANLTLIAMDCRVKACEHCSERFVCDKMERYVTAREAWRNLLEEEVTP